MVDEFRGRLIPGDGVKCEWPYVLEDPIAHPPRPDCNGLRGLTVDPYNEDIAGLEIWMEMCHCEYNDAVQEI